MRTLATLQEADAGTVTMGDIDVLRQKDEVRKLLGYLPQEFGVYPKINAETMLTHFAVLKGVVKKKERKEVVDALLHRVNLWDVRKQNLGTYSGGMRQRFGIAQALLGNPKLIIVDSLLEVIVEKASSIVEAERTSIFVFDPDRNVLWTRFAQGLGTATIEIPAGSGVAGAVAQTPASHHACHSCSGQCWSSVRREHAHRRRRNS